MKFKGWYNVIKKQFIMPDEYYPAELPMITIDDFPALKEFPLYVSPTVNGIWSVYPANGHFVAEGNSRQQAINNASARMFEIGNKKYEQACIRALVKVYEDQIK